MKHLLPMNNLLKRLTVVFLSLCIFLETSNAACYNQHLYLGISTNLCVTDPSTDQAIKARNDQVMATGVNFTFYSPTWRELEPQPGVYNFKTVDVIVNRALSYKLTIYLTIKTIDSNVRTMPTDLMTVPFDDPALMARWTNLINAMAPHFKGAVKLVVLGNEVNMYLRTHQAEAPAYLTYYKAAASQLKSLVPGVFVSTTLTAPLFIVFPAYMEGFISAVDFISTTYYPLNDNWQVRDPGINTLLTDLSYIKKKAGTKKILFQEIGYPSSVYNGSNEDKQAQFYANALSLLKVDPAYLGANFMLMSELSDSDAAFLTGTQGVAGSPTVRTFFQSIGLFDLTGRPKKAWKVFHDLVLAIKKSQFTGCDGSETMTLYPNPWLNSFHAGSNVTIEQVKPGSTVSIQDSTGKVVRQLTGVTGPMPWDLTNQTGQPLETGVYTAVYGGKSLRFGVAR